MRFRFLLWTLGAAALFAASQALAEEGCSGGGCAQSAAGSPACSGGGWQQADCEQPSVQYTQCTVYVPQMCTETRKILTTECRPEQRQQTCTIYRQVPVTTQEQRT